MASRRPQPLKRKKEEVVRGVRNAPKPAARKEEEEEEEEDEEESDEDEDEDYEPYPDYYPTRWNNMFASLFGVSEAAEDRKIYLTENWNKIIRRWYPNFHKKVYSAPPIHLKAVAAKPKPEKPYHPEEPYLRFGMQMYLTTRYSTTKDDEAQQRILWTFSTFCRNKSGAAFLLSNMEFQNYLNKSYQVPDPPSGDFPKPSFINFTTKNEDGEIEVLIVDKVYGIFVLEVKAVGDVDEFDEKKQMVELCDKFLKLGKQLKKETEMVRKLFSDLDPDDNIKVKGGFVFANVPRNVFENALNTYPGSVEEFQKNLGIHDNKLISGITFCAEDLPKRHTPGEKTLDPQIFHNIEKVWAGMETVYGKSKPMDDDLYEKIVARCCGPMTTVKIYTEKTYPRVKVNIIATEVRYGPGNKNVKQQIKTLVMPDNAKLPGGAAKIMARKFSELILLEDQIEVLQRNEEFVHLEGPPGTGKTLVLLLRILTWLDDGHIVWMLSLSPASRSVTHVLLEQVKRMINQYNSPGKAKELKERLRLFMLIRHELTLDEEYYKRRLMKFRLRAKTKDTHPYVGYPRPPTLPPVAAPHDRKVCLVLDESGMSGKGLHDFFGWVSKLQRQGIFRDKEFGKGLSVWSASVERVGRPCYAALPGRTNEERFGVLWDLKLPLRCPPTVQKALMLVQPSLDEKNICFFKKEYMLSHPSYPKDNNPDQGKLDKQYQYAADGLPVYLIGHGSHKKADENIWFCYECGDNLGHYLQNVLRIGQEQCSCEDKEINFGANFDNPARCPDCKKLEKGSLPACDLPLKYNDVMIVATQNAFLFSVPIGGFAHALAKRKLKISINTTREEGDAPIPPDDVILIADLTSVHGLERAVIIVVPEVNPPPPLPPQYAGMLFNPVEQPLPEHVLRQLAEQEAEGKGEAVFDAEGNRMEEVEEEEDEEGGGEEGERGEERGGEGKAEGAQFAKHDPTIQQGTKRGKEDLKASGNEDVEMRDTEPAKKPDGDRQKPYAETTADPQKPGVETKDGESAKRGDEEESAIPDQDKDPYTYSDSHSESQIKAALESLSPQSRRDIFYIGSRAVCQLILIHRAKEPEKEEPMQTE